MNFLRESLRNLSYYRHTDRHTYATEIIYSAASRVVKYRIVLHMMSIVSVVIFWCADAEVCRRFFSFVLSVDTDNRV